MYLDLQVQISGFSSVVEKDISQLANIKLSWSRNLNAPLQSSVPPYAESLMHPNNIRMVHGNHARCWVRLHNTPPSPGTNLNLHVLFSKMPPNIPKGDPECFLISGIAYSRGQINRADYISYMLAHLRGVRHAEDSSNIVISNPLSEAIQSCLFQSNFKPLAGKSKFENDVLLMTW